MHDTRHRLANGDTLYGTFLSLGSALAAEVCALAGFDWLLADLEHGSSGESELVAQQLAADAHGVPMFVRVESTDRVRAGRALDLGAAGIMFPRVDSPEQAEKAIQHLRYPPLGDRGVATYNRACAFGFDVAALETANDRIVGVVQIESGLAVERVDEIAAVAGVDVLFVGPRDLSHDLGVPGDVHAPIFRDALKRVLAAADANGKAVGILANDADTARHYADQGLRFIGVGSDATLLANAGKQTVNSVKTQVPGKLNEGQ